MASHQAWIVVAGLLLIVSVTMATPPRKPVDVPFGRNYLPTWAFDHIKYFNGGSEIQLLLDKYTGTGFQSKGSYLFGHFSMQMKLVPGDSAGTVTAFYLSSQNAEHDEIDFEFLGNRTAYHSYSVLWNMYQIVFFVDDVPIRVFKNCKEMGSFHIDGCEASVEAKFCATQGKRWWDQKEFQDLDGYQYRRLKWVRSRFTIYNYCTDRSRYPTMPAECKKDRDV
ncbi:hypothetical protein QYF36_023124 [Acer negundo]|nr:hypothetical protein QYF36_023124 [Acer negundo]